MFLTAFEEMLRERVGEVIVLNRVLPIIITASKCERKVTNQRQLAAHFISHVTSLQRVTSVPRHKHVYTYSED